MHLYRILSGKYEFYLNITVFLIDVDNFFITFYTVHLFVFKVLHVKCKNSGIKLQTYGGVEWLGDVWAVPLVA